MPFTALGLSATIQETLTGLGYAQPTPVQRQAIPKALEKRDIIAIAQTGTGKTAAFSLPIIQNLLTTPRVIDKLPRALILTPTRELAKQVQDDITAYAKDTGLSIYALYGGVGYGPQITALEAGVDIVIATPGRLRDLMHQKKIKLFGLEILVLDEADRMLDMGFSEDVNGIIKRTSEKRQTLLFSATFPDEVRTLAQRFLNKPISLSATPEKVTAQNVKHIAYAVENSKKLDLLFEILHKNLDEQVLIFARTKVKVDEVAKDLIARGLIVMATHGDRSQSHRAKAMARFMEQKIKILVATDIAARGLDTTDLGIVINYELPNQPEDYVHRIGRTGRAGRGGLAISIVTEGEVRYLAAVEKVIKFDIPLENFPGFEPATFNKQKRMTTGVTKRQHRGPQPSKGNASRTTKARIGKSSYPSKHGQTKRKPKR